MSLTLDLMFINFVKTVNALIKIVSFNQYHEKMKWAGILFRALIIKIRLNTLLKRLSVNHLHHLHGHLIFTISWHPQFCQNHCWLKKSFRRFNMVSCFCGLTWNLSFFSNKQIEVWPSPLVQNSKGLHICNDASNWWFNTLYASDSLICLVWW